MKHLKNIAPIVLILLLTFCTNQKSKKSLGRDYTKSELIGKWKQVNPDKSINDTDPKIEYVQLLRDSIAELQLIYSNGERKISGNWNAKFEKEIEKSGIKIESDIRITYNLDKNNRHTLLLKLTEEDEKLIMNAHNYKFIKE